MTPTGIAGSTIGSGLSSRDNLSRLIWRLVSQQVFHSKYALHSHYKQSSDHHFCVVCEKDFVDEDTLEYHSAEEHSEGHYEHPDNTWLW